MTIANDLAYLAGLVDGEGCLFVSLSGSRACRLEITMTDRTVIQWLEKKFGGFITSGGKKLPKCTWVLSRREPLEDTLTRLDPYLICKRAQARAMVEVIRFSYQRGKIPKEEWIAQDRLLRQEVREARHAQII